MANGWLTAPTGRKFNFFSNLWESVSDYIFPKECFGCSKEGEYLCSACFDKIRLFDEFPCFICNQGEFESGICPDCAQSTGIDRIIVATRYKDNFAGELVEALKYDFLESTAQSIAGLLIAQIEKKELQNVLSDAVIIPIPLHKKRFAERGFNQSALLAERLGMFYNCEVREDLLFRQKNTAQQAKLNREDRQENVKDAFSFEPSIIIPEKAILIDDVLTTGSTFSQSAQVLKASGVKQVCCLAVCHG
jgi:competence protein ComFC